MTAARPSRRGVTLLELLIVLVLLGMASALVAPMLGSTGARGNAADDTTAPLIARARALAVRRAEPLTLTLASTGTWTIRTVRGDAAIDSGAMRSRSAESLRAASYTFDALGGCLPGAHETTDEPFDALACRASGDAANGSLTARSAMRNAETAHP